MDRALRITLAIAAGFLIFTGLLAFAAFVAIVVALPSEENLQISAMVGAVAALHLGFGVAILYQSIRSLQGALPRSFNPPLWALALSFVAALGIGTGVLAMGGAAVIVFPFFHLLALTFPSLAILAIVPRWGLGLWRKERPMLAELAGPGEVSTSYTPGPSTDHPDTLLSWRSITNHLAFGAFISSFFAIAVEFVVGAILGLVLLLAILANQEGETLTDLLNQLQASASSPEPELLRRLILSPAVLVGLVAMLVVVAPLTEEFFKSLGVALLSRQFRSPLQAWTFGLAAGLGFAMIESLLYNGLSLSIWWSSTLLRVGTAFIHALGTGLMGLGWYYAMRKGLPGRLLGMFAASVGLHGLWNGISLAIMIAGLVAFGQISEDLVPPEALSSSGLLVLGLTAVLLALAAGVIGSIVFISKRLARAWLGYACEKVG